MLVRHLHKTILHLSKKYPILTLTGPRQSGKTTLARTSFPRHSYVSLEDPDIRIFAENDPRGFLNQFKKGVILDEVQRVPDLFSYLQTLVDLNPKAGQFILTGSHQFLLNKKIAQTLAGRTALLRLLPCSLSELLKRKAQTFWQNGRLVRTSAPKIALHETLWRGFYPRIHDQSLSPTQFYRDYVDTYVSRDVQELLAIGDLKQFHTFLRLLAGRSGQRLNMVGLGNDAGVSHTTVRRWLSLLEAGFIIYLLPPHYKNMNKRLVKAPKVYFIDTGLLCYLLQIRSAHELTYHPLIGAIFENFVFGEIYKAFYHHGAEAPLYFWQNHTGYEIDFLLDEGNTTQAIEVKSSQTLSQDFFTHIRDWLALPGNPASRGHLIYGGDLWQERHAIQVWPWYGVS